MIISDIIISPFLNNGLNLDMTLEGICNDIDLKIYKISKFVRLYETEIYSCKLTHFTNYSYIFINILKHKNPISYKRKIILTPVFYAFIKLGRPYQIN